MEENKKKRQRYLNRIILRVALLGYVTATVLLLALDTNFFINYQRQFIGEQQEIMSQEIVRLSNSLSSLKNYVYERWYGDYNFAKLGVYSSNSNTLTYRYELMEELRLNMSMNKHIIGFFVFYTGKENCVYVMDDRQIMPDEAVGLRDLLAAYHQSVTPAAREYFVLSSDSGRSYALIGYTKGNATIYGVCSLSSTLDNIRGALPKESRLILSADPFVKMEEESDALLVQEALDSAGSHLAYQKNWNLVIGERVPDTNFRIVAVIPQSVYSVLNIQIVLGLVLLAGSVVVLIWLIRFLREQLILPLRDMKLTMDSICQGEGYRVEERFYGLHELDEVNRTFRYMMAELEEQKVATYEEVLEKQKARIQYLQLQLKPHFYLNGLKTVNALALIGDIDRLQEYLQRLSGHIRYLLSLEKDEIGLKDELLFTENYVNL